MTPELIEKLAQKACDSVEASYGIGGLAAGFHAEFAKDVARAVAHAVAALVAAHQRELDAKVVEAGIANATDWDSSFWDQACQSRAAAIRGTK